MAKTFDPKAVSLIVGGHIVGGFADGTFVSVERNNDSYSRVGGADGEQTRARSNDKSGRFTFTLLQSSTSNSVLQGFQIADEVGNSGQVPVMVKDGNGSELVVAAAAWVVKPANVEHGKEVSNREWVLETGNVDFFGGGISS